MAGTPGIKVLDLQKQGFDMVISNKVRPSTFGGKIVVEVNSGSNQPGIKKIANKMKKTDFDGAWLFTTTKVNDALKSKARDMNVTVFDVADIDRLSTGEKLSSFLTSNFLKAPSK